MKWPNCGRLYSMYRNSMTMDLSCSYTLSIRSKKVTMIEIDSSGKMRLSRKAALKDQPAVAEQEKLKIAPSASPA